MIMVNLWHPCRKIDVWHTKDQEEGEVAVNQGYIPLSHLRHTVRTHEVMKKRIEDQNNYIFELGRLMAEKTACIWELEKLIETGTERD
ncbi:hypothetical protein LCGC14_1478510 [marine sediment metagenome]|uniref:Uncharacterized protein n=1 Tax=marine sediment metagenome TaxID=412755 RepID=A0A0F9JA93_9ZZZZ